MKARWYESGRHGLLDEWTRVVSLGWQQVTDRFEQPVVVEPGHPFQRGQFHSFEVAPLAALIGRLQASTRNAWANSGNLVR